MYVEMRNNLLGILIGMLILEPYQFFEGLFYYWIIFEYHLLRGGRRSNEFHEKVYHSCYVSKKFDIYVVFSLHRNLKLTLRIQRDTKIWVS